MAICEPAKRCRDCIDVSPSPPVSDDTWTEISRRLHGHGNGTVHDVDHIYHTQLVPQLENCATCRSEVVPKEQESTIVAVGDVFVGNTYYRNCEFAVEAIDTTHARGRCTSVGHNHVRKLSLEKFEQGKSVWQRKEEEYPQPADVNIGDSFVPNTSVKNRLRIDIAKEGCEFTVNRVDGFLGFGPCTIPGHNHMHVVNSYELARNKSVWQRKEEVVEIGDVFVGTHSDFTGCEFTVESISRLAAFGQCKIEGHTHTLVLKLSLFREGKSIWKRKEEPTVKPLAVGDPVTPVHPEEGCPSVDCDIVVESITAAQGTARSRCNTHMYVHYISIPSFNRGAYWKHKETSSTIKVGDVLVADTIAACEITVERISSANGEAAGRCVNANHGTHFVGLGAFAVGKSHWKHKVYNDVLCTIDIRCEGCDYLVRDSQWQYVEAARLRHGHADGTIHDARHPNHRTAPDQQSCACKELAEPNRYRFEGTITKVERLPCPDCRAGEELNASVLCNKCGAKHRCKHSNTRCTEFKPTCPHCRTVLARPLSANAIGLPQVVIRFRGGSAYHTCNRCGEEFPSITEMSEQQLTFTEENMATVKTYKIEALKEHVENYLEAVAELDEAIAAHNEQQKATYLDRMTTYLDEGKYTDPETQEEIDHSDRSLDDRRQHLSVGRVFALSTARHNFGTERAERLSRILGALEGETVELDPDEALDYLALPERTQEAKKTTERYQVAEDEEAEE